MRDRPLVVVDVDNTLYDWVALWAGAFRALLHTLVERTGFGEDHWIRAVHDVHLRRRAIECPSLLADVAAAPSWPAHLDADAPLRAAAAAYRDYWDHHLTPYPGIRDTLSHLAASGHVIVAYTESDASIAASRLARLGLAGAVRHVFGRSPLPSSADPAWCTMDGRRSCPIAVDFIPREDTKPNPTGLRTIMARLGAAPEDTVYAGDNLWKDVLMHEPLGVRALWARYGTRREPRDAALVERVAYWTPRDVAAENAATPPAAVDRILDHPSELAVAVARAGLATVS